MFAIAAAARFISSFWLSRQTEPEPLPVGHREMTLRALPKRLFGAADGRLILYLLAMQLAASLYLRRDGIVCCAKLHHHNSYRCIFNCRFRDLLAREQAAAAAGAEASNSARKLTIHQPGSTPPATTTLSR